MVKNRIKELRKNLCISQEDLARLADTTLRTIQNIENDKTDTQLTTAFKIKKALKAENLESIFHEND